MAAIASRAPDIMAPEPFLVWRDGWRLALLYRREAGRLHLLDCGDLTTIHLAASDERHFRPAILSRRFAGQIDRRRRLFKRLGVRHAEDTALAVVKALGRATG